MGVGDATRANCASTVHYDRDEAGELRHLYTDTFHDRSLEAVQRQAAHSGFGAANASVRSLHKRDRSLPATYML